MKDSTKRTLRTGMQLVVALATAIPLIVFALPDDVQATPVAACMLAWVGVVTRVLTSLEDAGLIPAWLRDIEE